MSGLLNGLDHCHALKFAHCSFVRLFVRSFVHSFVRSSVRSSVRSLSLSLLSLSLLLLLLLLLLFWRRGCGCGCGFGFGCGWFLLLCCSPYGTATLRWFVRSFVAVLCDAPWSRCEGAGRSKLRARGECAGSGDGVKPCGAVGPAERLDEGERCRAHHRWVNELELIEV